MPDEALYQLSRGEVSDFITKERRKDELDRVREVQVQKRVWKNTMGVCTAAVVALLGLALWGLFK